MLKLLERHIASIDERLVILAPPQASVPATFRNLTFNRLRHTDMIRGMQRLRGSVYLEDGAVERRQLAYDGSHRTPEDARSWHLLIVNKQRGITACAWYLQHDANASFENLRVRNCPLAHQDGWREKLWAAVELELARARQNRLRYAEVGGWAVAKESRCTSEGLLLALAAYSLGRLMGGALGLTTATVRNSSSTILRRLGGSHLEVDGTTVPPYFDPHYKCTMELLRFDSRGPEPKYAGMIEMMKERLSGVPILARTTPFASRRTPQHVPVSAPQYAA